MGLFNKKSASQQFFEDSNAAKNYVSKLEKYTNNFNQIKADPYNIGLLKLYFYPVFAYLCRSTVNWKELKGSIDSEIAERVDFYTSEGKQGYRETQVFVSSLTSRFEKLEKEARSSKQNPVKYIFDSTMVLIEEGRTAIPLSIYSLICNTVNSVITDFDLSSYASYTLPVPQFIGVPNTEPVTLTGENGEKIQTKWSYAFKYNGTKYYCMTKENGESLYISKLTTQNDNKKVLTIIKGDLFKELSAIYIRIKKDGI